MRLQVFGLAIIALAAPAAAGSLLLQHAHDLQLHRLIATANHVVGLAGGDGPHDGPKTYPGPQAFAASAISSPSHTSAPPAPWSLGTTFDSSVRPTVQEPYIDMVVGMSGQCSTLKIAGRNFACKAVRYFHGLRGRAYFTIVVDDPNDDSHVISFSGEDSSKKIGNLYELTIDRMMFNSKDRPKVEGVLVARAEVSTGLCKQRGDLAAKQISSVSCNALDKDGNRYELQFESDGSPITVQDIEQYPLSLEKYRAKRRVLRECRHKAQTAKILPRDQTAYIIACLGSDDETPAAHQ